MRLRGRLLLPRLPHQRHGRHPSESDAQLGLHHQEGEKTLKKWFVELVKYCYPHLHYLLHSTPSLSPPPPPPPPGVLPVLHSTLPPLLSAAAQGSRGQPSPVHLRPRPGRGGVSQERHSANEGIFLRVQSSQRLPTASQGMYSIHV